VNALLEETLGLGLRQLVYERFEATDEDDRSFCNRKLSRPHITPAKGGAKRNQRTVAQQLGDGGRIRADDEKRSQQLGVPVESTPVFVEIERMRATLANALLWAEADLGQAASALNTIVGT
jgi:hypothetical protein